jgi:hypothetical protein
MAGGANLGMELKLELLLEKGQTVRTHVQKPAPIFFWERAVIANLHKLVCAILQELYCLHFSSLIELIDHALVPAVVMDVIREVRELWLCLS